MCDMCVKSCASFRGAESSGASAADVPPSLLENLVSLASLIVPFSWRGPGYLLLLLQLLCAPYRACLS